MTFKGLATHDELVSTTGLNAWFLKDVPRDGEEVLKLEKENVRRKGWSLLLLVTGIFRLEL